MCGILAIHGQNLSNQFTKTKLDAQIEKVNHRGPDNINSDYYNDTYLAQSRLSIVDLDERANQPFECDGYVMVYNGEIFNFREIRNRLIEIGLSFETNSDTEVVIKSYIAWGDECFSKFNGMWALVIKNLHDGSIVVSRDRFGQKPLFYSHHRGTYFFCSEPHQINELVDSEPCLNSIRNFILEGDALSDGRTFFHNIFEFPAAHTLAIDSELKTRIKKYWDYPTTEEKTTDSKIKQFYDTLYDAVKIRLHADVPVSICLSGGIDSTIIASIASEIEPTSDLNFFTHRAFDQSDESNFAVKVSERLSGNITLVEQQGSAQQYINDLKALVINMGRGHSSPAIISSDLVHRKISDNSFKVSINGQGADELLAGYKTHYIHTFIDYFFKFEFRKLYKSFQHMLSQKSQFSNQVLKSVIIRYFRDNSGPALRIFLRRLYGYGKIISYNKIEFVNENIFKSQESAAFASASRFKKHLLKQHKYGLKDLLFYEDIVAMRNSVENRSPFLDHRLVELSFSCDQDLKIENGVEKIILRRSSWFKQHKDVLQRDKVGFQSNIRFQTKCIMREQLYNSPILELPIFTKYFHNLLRSDTLLSPKYERLLFRIFQVHLWFVHFKG